MCFRNPRKVGAKEFVILRTQSVSDGLMQEFDFTSQSGPSLTLWVRRSLQKSVAFFSF